MHILNDCIISDVERIILSLGLNFVPSPRKRKFNILQEAMERFTRSVSIKKHFANQLTDNRTALPSEILLHSRISRSLSLTEANRAFEPDITRSPIENYLTTASNTLLSEVNKNTDSRLQPVWIEYYKIVNQLGSRSDIIIKPSDKNLGVTVMSRDWYIAAANAQLNNPAVYSKIDNYSNVKKLIDELKSIVISQDWLPKHRALKLYKDLTTDITLDRVKLCRMYFLPKLHKKAVGMRPICASQGWITYWTSVYIHLTMYPLLKAIPTYIANSAELVSKLDQVKPPDYFQFIAADVDNLYPSINIDEGLDALKYFLKHSTGFCLQQIRFILLLTR